MSTNTYRLLAIIVLLVFAGFAVQYGESITGEAARRSRPETLDSGQYGHEVFPSPASIRTPKTLYQVEYCPEGCPYGNYVPLKTSSGTVVFTKKDLAFQKCHIPEKDGCMHEHDVLYATEYKGAPTQGIFVCSGHDWVFTQGIIPPCPPEPPKPY